MVGEVYGWEPGNGREYDFGDRKVDYFAHGYDALINFGFKREAAGSLDSLFAGYAGRLHGPALRGAAILNYISSHDDGSPYDPERKDPLGAGTRLLLAPGGAQIYYGDEVARPLRVAGAEGDANLRSSMTWDAARSRRRGRARALAEAGALPPGPSGGGRRRASDAAGRAATSSAGVSRPADRSDRVLVAMGQGEGSEDGAGVRRVSRGDRGGGRVFGCGGRRDGGRGLARRRLGPGPPRSRGARAPAPESTTTADRGGHASRPERVAGSAADARVHHRGYAAP